ncbi:Uncharacterised protein [Mycobacteroides abscessus]|nr:Uncharacterised protein [Mycobacteroides abscessus]
MIATTTGGMAHGMSARTRVRPWSRSPELSRSARPIAATSWSSVTETAQIMPMRNESQKNELSARRTKLSTPTNW